MEMYQQQQQIFGTLRFSSFQLFQAHAERIPNMALLTAYFTSCARLKTI